MRNNLEVYDAAGRKPLFGYEAEQTLKRTLPNNLEALDPDYFFNSLEIKKALSLLSPGLAERRNEKVAVYFNSIQGFRAVSDRFWGEERRGNWWDPIQKHFLPGIRKIPTGMRAEYFYDSGIDFRVTPNFNPGERIYQIFVHMFGGALRAFGCFVGKNRPEITFSSNNHVDKPPWYGSLGDFLSSEEVLEQTLREMKEKGYETGWESTYTSTLADVRLVHPESGMVLMRTTPQEIYDLVEDESGKLKFGTRKLPKTIILQKESLRKLSAA